MIKLSLLIPSIIGREESLTSLIKEIDRQCGGLSRVLVDSYGEYEDLYFYDFNSGVQCIVYVDNKESTIGKKRNRLLELSEGDYVAFIDDDDRISEKYIELLMQGVSKGVDCCSLKGIFTIDGRGMQVFEHSLKYNGWKTNHEQKEVTYERYPNHLNCIKASIAKQFSFTNKNHGEDFDWSKAVHEAGIIKTEHYIDEILYYYDFKTKK